MAIGCYEPLYNDASYKGVPFVATEITSKHGRRGAEGEFPFGENTAYADLGRKIRRYTLRGRLQENSHIADAQTLIDACEGTGPGILVHPTRGIVNAACVQLTVRDDIEREQGVTYVDLDMVEANEWPNGFQVSLTAIGISVQNILAASTNLFNSNYQPTTSQLYYRDSVRGRAEDAITIIADEYDRALGTSGTNDQFLALADLRLIASDGQHLNDVSTVQTAILQGSNAVANVLTGTEKVNAFRRIANSQISNTGLAGVAGTSQTAVQQHVRITAAAFIGQGAVEQSYERAGSVIDALAIVQTLIGDEILAARAAGQNTLHVELRNYLTDIQDQMYAKALATPRLTDYNFNGAVHSLNAAYSIFNDAKRHRELEIANVINHAGKIGPLVTARRTVNA